MGDNHKILLVDKEGRAIGYEDKVQVHKRRLLHKAFSLLILNKKKTKMLIQKRAKNKYHSGGLWANACCSHEKESDKGKKIEDIVKQRCYEETGIDLEHLNFIYTFHYDEKVGRGLYENEIDNVFVAFIDETQDLSLFDKQELEELKWIEIPKLIKDVKCFPHLYSVWFRIILASDRF